MVNKLYTDEFHVKIQTNLNTDVTGYTSLKSIIKKPSGATLSKDLTVVDDEEGIVFFLTAVGDFDEVGTYYTQIELIFSNATYLSDTVSFVVNDSYT